MAQAGCCIRQDQHDYTLILSPPDCPEQCPLHTRPLTPIWLLKAARVSRR